MDERFFVGVSSHPQNSPVSRVAFSSRSNLPTQRAPTYNHEAMSRTSRRKRRTRERATRVGTRESDARDARDTCRRQRCKRHTRPKRHVSAHETQETRVGPRDAIDTCRHARQVSASPGEVLPEVLFVHLLPERPQRPQHLVEPRAPQLSPRPRALCSATKETMQPCLVRRHAISLVATALDPVGAGAIQARGPPAPRLRRCRPRR